MRRIKKWIATALMLCCFFSLAACESFYQLFVDENDTSSGVYVAIYNKDSDEKTLSEIPEVPFMKGDLRGKIKDYELSFEVTLAFDLETSNEASLSLHYYHNRENADAADYCDIGLTCFGIYTMEDNKIIFRFEPDGYNTAMFYAGSDYADLDEFKNFSYAEDGSCGVWAYANAPWEYEASAVILEDVVKILPAAIEITTSGRKITDWKALEQ